MTAAPLVGLEEQRKAKRCPGCKSVEVTFTETYALTLKFDQTAEGTLPSEGAGGTPYMSPLHVLQGQCRICRHTWSVRGCHQATDLPNHPDHFLKEAQK